MEVYMNAEKETAVLIKLDKNKQLTVEARGVFLPDGIQLCLAAIEAMCKTTLSRATDSDLLKSLEEDMYEMINIGASSLLSKLFPHIELRPDITVDAIMKAENELIDEKAKEYATAYAESAQSEKDIYEHNLVKANLAAKDTPSRKKATSKKK